MVRSNGSKVITSAALVGVVALAGCSSSASDSASPSAGSGSASASNAVNDATTSAPDYAQFIDTQATSDSPLSITNPGIPAMVQACQQQSLGINPVVVINYTGQPQTFNYTDNSELTGLATFANPTPPAGFNCQFSSSMDVATSQPVTVPAGQTMATVVIAGGQVNYTDKPEVQGGDHNLSIGGGASGNTQWYDFYLHLAGGVANSFGNWELAYQNTGGLNPSQNTQPGLLNVVECSMSSDGTITTGAAVINGTLTQLPQTTIATPYGSNTNRWTYNTTNPICLGFFDQNAAGVAFNPAS